MMKPTTYMGLGVLFLFSGFGLAAGDVHPSVNATVMTCGLILILRGVRLRRHGEEALKCDERTRKLGAWAATYSWFATLMATSILYWLDYLDILKLQPEIIYGTIVMFMSFSMLAFRWVLAWKGDVS
ncbi:MAG: hypothetical protein GF416_08065 [Candidatus Altiarchaeales archaeon]|nr:hypothetical protein [Candidatus Altiarchaeales archaeon]MBD3417069.1 hypothetical protein [Candidatus Altiarchaeales archaeon]